MDTNVVSPAATVAFYCLIAPLIIAAGYMTFHLFGALLFGVLDGLFKEEPREW